jgi:hypothetical protein
MSSSLGCSLLALLLLFIFYWIATFWVIELLDYWLAALALLAMLLAKRALVERGYR